MIICLDGPCGVGKTTVGEYLQKVLNIPLLEYNAINVNEVLSFKKHLKLFNKYRRSLIENSPSQMYLVKNFFHKINKISSDNFYKIKELYDKINCNKLIVINLQDTDYFLQLKRNKRNRKTEYYEGFDKMQELTEFINNNIKYHYEKYFLTINIVTTNKTPETIGNEIINILLKRGII